MLVAGRQANVNRKPLVFDPVAVGATAYRREASRGACAAHARGVHGWLTGPRIALPLAADRHQRERS